jgi:hypothetical protein
LIEELGVVSGSIDGEQRRMQKRLEARCAGLNAELKGLTKECLATVETIEEQCKQSVLEMESELSTVNAELAKKDADDEEIEDAFMVFLKMPRLRFECCMLQVPVEDADGALSWRDMSCDDVDDLSALRSRAWEAEDFVAGDGVLHVPVGEGLKPGALLRKYMGTLLQVQHVLGGSEDAAGHAAPVRASPYTSATALQASSPHRLAHEVLHPPPQNPLLPKPSNAMHSNHPHRRTTCHARREHRLHLRLAPAACNTRTADEASSKIP